MNVYDIVMLAVVILATILGVCKGFVWQIASLASIAVSYIVAMRFRGSVAELIGGQPPWNHFLAMLLLYIGTSLVIWMAFQVVSKTIDQWKLKGFDRQIGALMGAAKGALLCIIITLFAVTLLEEPLRRTIIDSRSGYYIAHILDRAHGVMPPELHDVLEPYLHRLDERLDGYGHGHYGRSSDDHGHSSDRTWYGDYRSPDNGRSASETLHTGRRARSGDGWH